MALRIGWRWVLLVFAMVLALAPELRLLCQQPTVVQPGVVRLFRAGQQDMQSGQFTSAITKFRKVLELQPGLVQAEVNLGLAYHAHGDYELAVSELRRAASKQPELLPANLFLGLSYMKLGSAGEAIPALRRALAIDPSNQAARKALATAEMSEGDYRKAAVEFRTIAAAQPNKADAWFFLGHSYLQMAKQLTMELSLNHRDSAWSLRLAGDVLAGRRLWNNAAQAYQRALQADPAQPGLHAALGDAFLGGGEIEEAGREFKAELSRDPYQLQGQLGLARVDLLKANVPAALDAIASIWNSSPEFLVQALPDFPAVEIAPKSARQMADELHQFPGSPGRQSLLAALYQSAGNSKDANRERQEFDASATAAIAQNQRIAAPAWSACERHREGLCVRFLMAQKRLRLADLLLLGHALLAIGQNGAAAGAFASVLADDKNNAETQYWLSRSYLKLTDACFTRLQASYPDSWRTYELEGETFQIGERDKQAIAAYAAAERLKPDDAEIHESLAELFLAEAAVQKARSELQTALQLDPGAARSLYLLGRLYMSQREPARAIPYLEEAVRRDPGLVEARPVLGKAYLRAGEAALAIPQLERSAKLDRYGDLHYLLYEAYQQEGKSQLAAQALARSQELSRQSAAEDQAKIRAAYEE